MKMIRRFGLMLMLLGMLAVTAGARCASAADGDVATVNGESYSSLSSAMTVWRDNPGSTLTLLKDCVSDVIDLQNAKNTYAIDLNGHTLTCSDSNFDLIKNNGTLTIKNGTLKGAYGVNNQEKGTLSLIDVKIIATNAGVQNYGSTTLTGDVSIDANYAFRYGKGELDLSGLSGKNVEGWRILASESGVDLRNITLPSGYGLWHKGEVVNTLEKSGQVATINPTTPIASYKITIQQSLGGAVTTDKASAQAGETVKLTSTPEVGYVLSEVTVTAANGGAIAVAEGTFTMPGADVMVSGVFSPCPHSDTDCTYTADVSAGTIAKVCGCGQRVGSVTLSAPEQRTYDGQTKAAVVQADDDFGAYTLTYNTADGTPPINAGDYTATLVAGQTSVSVTYTIAPATLRIAEVKIGDVPYEKNGVYEFAAADVTFSGLAAGAVLVEGVDYSVSVEQPVSNQVGSVEVRVKVTLSNGNYQLNEASSVGVAATVSITQASIAGADVTIVPAADLSYTGEAITPAVIVRCNGAVLTPDVDYTVTYSGNINASADGAQVIVTGVGNFTGTNDSCKFQVAPADISAADVHIKDQIYTGNALTPEVQVTWNGKPLQQNVDYEVAQYADNTMAGTATVKIVGKGNFAGAKTGSFNIRPSGVKLTAVESADAYTYGEVIRVTGEIAATGETPPQRSEAVLLIYGEAVLATAQVSSGAFVLSYESAQKRLPVGAHTLQVQYVGVGNLAEATADVEITLQPKPLIIERAEAVDRDYILDDRRVALKKTLLNGILGQDDVSVTAETGMVSSANAGNYTRITLPEDAALAGTHATFYTLAARDAPTSVNIRPRKVTAVEAPSSVKLDAYCATVEQVIAKLPATLPCQDANGNTYHLPVNWASMNENDAPYDALPATANTFGWTVNADANFTVPDGVGQGCITVTNVDALPVNNKPNNKTIVYGGTDFDVSLLFDVDPNAGARTYAIAGGDGVGTLDGTMLAITKAGEFVIKLSTAANAMYAAGEATAVLTVSKGEPACDAPTNLTAVCGQTLADVPLPTAEGGVWRWKDASTKISEAGQQVFKAVFVPAAADLWRELEMDVSISVTKADEPQMGTADTYRGDMPETCFSYGEIITVKATLSGGAAQAKQLALFYGAVQLTAPVEADAQGVYTLSYNTTDKLLPAGESTVTACCVNDDNRVEWSAELPVIIEPAVLRVTQVTLEDRPYEPGNQMVYVSSAGLAGLMADADNVQLDVTACQVAIDSDAAGLYDAVTLPAYIALQGDAAQFYTVQGGMTLPASVEITKAEPTSTGDVKPTVDKDYTPGITLGELTPALPEGTFDVPGSVSWIVAADTPVTPGQAYEWVFTPADTANYKPVTGTMVIYAHVPPVVTAIPPVVTPMPPVITPTLPVFTPTPPVVTPEPPTLPTVIHPAQDQLVALNAGETMVLTIQAVHAAHYQWYVDRGDGSGYRLMSGETNAQLIIVGAAEDQASRYFCRIANADGVIDSPVFILEVLPAVDLPLTGDRSSPTVWAVLLLASAAGLLMFRKYRFGMD